MKATGIVRKIDDLGRIVIPKEIRRTMRIREGDPLEIFTEKDGTVLFKKYSQIGEISSFSDHYAEAISNTTGFATAITDKDTVISVSGIPKKEIVGKSISDELSEILDDRMTYGYMDDEEAVPLIDSSENYKISIACPVVCQGEAIGSVVIFFNNDVQKLGETEEKIAQTSATVLSKMVDE